ncbi:MAG: hypothetical protein HFJ09_15390 [Lachnospiraceae bacterium]|nr:hypothetical protein [Lachnospiraceae bacterium]
MKKKILWLMGIIIVVLVAAVFIHIAKVGVGSENPKNEIGTDLTFYDANRRFIKALSIECNADTEDTFEQEFEVENGKIMEFFLKENTMNNDIVIEVLDESGKHIVKKEIKADNSKMIKINDSLKEGKYKLFIQLKKNTIGTLELDWDEK